MRAPRPPFRRVASGGSERTERLCFRRDGKSRRRQERSPRRILAMCDLRPGDS